MIENQPTKTNRETRDEHAQAGLSSNRRQFLKYTALSGISGLIDGPLMNRTASAAPFTHIRPTRTPPSNDAHRRQDKRLRVTGVGEDINYYSIEMKEIIVSREESDSPPIIDETVIEGQVREDKTNVYQIQGDVTTVYTEGSITYRIE